MINSMISETFLVTFYSNVFSFMIQLSAIIAMSLIRGFTLVNIMSVSVGCLLGQCLHHEVKNGHFAEIERLQLQLCQSISVKLGERT